MRLTILFDKKSFLEILLLRVLVVHFSPFRRPAEGPSTCSSPNLAVSFSPSFLFVLSLFFCLLASNILEFRPISSFLLYFFHLALFRQCVCRPSFVQEALPLPGSVFQSLLLSLSCEVFLSLSQNSRENTVSFSLCYQLKNVLTTERLKLLFFTGSLLPFLVFLACFHQDKAFFSLSSAVEFCLFLFSSSSFFSFSFSLRPYSLSFGFP